MNTAQDAIDLDFVRGHFPGLAADWVFFDNAGGSQIVQGAVDKISEFLIHRNVQTGGSYAVSKAAAEGLMLGRDAAKTLVNAARPEEIVFGPSTTQLVRTLASAMRGQLQPGDEIIVSHADHESNIGPWDALREFGVVIKNWPLDQASMSMRLEDLDPLMTPRTKLVCIHHVSNILGSINPVKEFAAFVHERGARICVDGVAYAPHRAIDVQDWDVDYYIFSIYKCYGPHMAIMYGKYDLLGELDGQYHYFYGKDKVPGKLEPGNPNYELAYSTVGVVDYLIALGTHLGGEGSDRARLEAAYAGIARQEDVLAGRLISWLEARNDCHIIGRGMEEGRVPTIAFKFDDLNSEMVAREMDKFGIAIRFGDFHSRRLVEDLKETGQSGCLRVSMVHYNSVAQVDALTEALASITCQMRMAS
ncbi:aminotransferase class V-fold PLP-dependent enzyme [Thioclava sp. IC9]|uniref:aminotransferase class V-fold PLP-dependent enzyme n=1 Tax=Thioclava sp. IC9 TaxID=1973007 RepID=UPI000B548246|nr:aminotransferase class V-fold PLP-dependent enzyme [Thioclava sp. IC9]OWX98654.1 cysteine desulfurase-like protein [Thioclava sp. IC9]